jgi:triacylglycerol lipase
VLALRGTGFDSRDWATDLNAPLVPWTPGGQVRGFAEALEAVWDSIAAVLPSIPGRLLYTGHSLGAALATLTASRRAPHALYTYGSPRVGDAVLDEVTRLLHHHRHTHCCGIVCRLPPEAMAYRHTGPLAYLHRRAVLHSMPSEEFVADDQHRAQRAYLRHWSWRPGTMWTRDAADHSPVNYVAALSRSSPGPSALRG